MGKYSDMLQEEQSGGKYSAMLLEQQPVASNQKAPNPAEGGLPFRPFGVNTGLKMPEWLSQGMAGFGKSFVDTGTGLQQLVATGDRDAELRRQIEEQRRIDAPLMETGAGLTGNIAGMVAQTIVPGMALSKVTRVPTLVRAGQALIDPKTKAAAAAGGAAFGLTQPTVSDTETAANVALGAGGSVAGKVIGDKLATVVAPVIQNAPEQIDEVLRASGVDFGKLADDVKAGLVAAHESGTLTPEAIRRVAVAQSLPVPTEITKGAALRGAGQGFDAEHAEASLRLMAGPAGDKIREADARINQQLLANFEHLKNRAASPVTGKDATGSLVREAVETQGGAAKDLAVKFLTSGKDAGASQIIDPSPIISAVQGDIDAIIAGNSPGGGTAMSFLVRNGLAARDEAGNIISTGKKMTAKQAMEFYHALNRSTDKSGVYGAKQGVLQALEGANGGDDFRKGVRLFKEYMQKYENPKAMQTIIRTFGQSGDPAVASEQLFDNMMKLGIDDLSAFRKTLLSGDKATRSQAVDAMRAMRGQLVDRLRRAAMSGMSDTEVGGTQLRSFIEGLGGKDLATGFRKIETILGPKDTATLRKLEETIYNAKYRGSPAHKTPGTAERLMSFLANVPIVGTPASVARKVSDIKAEQAAKKMAETATEVLPKPKPVSRGVPGLAPAATAAGGGGAAYLQRNDSRR